MLLICTVSAQCTLKALTSEATTSATQFFKRSYKISHNPVDALPSFAAWSKIEPDFSREVVLKLTLPKNHFNKNCAPKILFFNKKENQKDSNDFLRRKFTVKVQF